MYYGYQGWTNNDSVESVTVPDNTISIGENCFSGCNNLQAVSLPDSLEELGRDAFNGCSALTTLEVPSGVGQILENCFRGCTGMTEIILPESVNGIEKHAFYGCSALQGIVIPDGVGSIGAAAFHDCTGLTSVTLPITAAYDCGTGSYELEIKANATFYNCANVEGIHYTKGSGEVMQYADNGRLYLYQFSLPYIARMKLTTVTLEEGITETPENLLRDCSKVEGIVLPDTIKKIGDYTFAGCKLGPETEMPSGLEELGKYAFRDCIGLTTLEVPSGVGQIPEYCFGGCSSISTINLPFSVDIISTYAFNQCTGLSDVYFSGSEMEASGILIENNNAALDSATWHYALKNPNEGLTLKLPEQLKDIEEEAFIGMGAEVIIIPASTHNIKAGAFKGCDDLKAIIFEGSPQSIANDIVTDPQNVTVFVIKDSETEAWARQAGFRVKYNLN